MGKFKVGDKLRVLRDGNIERDWHQEGCTVTVERLSADGRIKKLKESDAESIWSHNDNWYELIESTEMSKLYKLQAKYEELGEEIKKLKEDKVKKIDFSKIPEGVLVEVNEIGIRHFKSAVGRDYNIYISGKNPLCTDVKEYESNLYTVSCIRLVDNPPQPWFGGNCPLPDNVTIKVWYRNGDSDICTLPDSAAQCWEHNDWDGDIIAYQILASDWQN